MAKELTDIELRRLADDLGLEWQKLATFLGFRLAKIQQFEIDHHDNNDEISNTIFNMLVAWRQRQPVNSNFRKIMKTALEHCDRFDLAGSLLPDPSEERLADTILHDCQQHLRHHYINSLCKIPLFPGDNENLINLKDIYTKLAISMNLPKPCHPVKIPLDSYDEIFTRKSYEGALYTRILISAPAGLGKSTITAKIAYDWATKVDESPLKDVPLLFVLNMRWLDHTSNLEEAILTHVFPEDTNVTAEQLQSLLRDLGEKVIIILDAVDESDRMLYNHPENSGSIVKLLTGKILVTCRLMVMTRPWRIAEITRKCNSFTLFEIQGFKKEDIRNYIRKFFHDNNALGKSLIEYMDQNELIANVASVPLMALLVCVYWREIQGEEFPNRISHLYDAIINIMNQHHLTKQDPAVGSQEDRGDLQLLIRELGKMALKGLWPPENRVVFYPRDHADEESDKAVNTANLIGLVTIQKARASALSQHRSPTLTFFHKSCAEKCAGTFLAWLAQEYPEQLEVQLKSLKTVQDAISVKLLLQFGCGAHTEAANLILQRLMQIFRHEFQSTISDYYSEDLELDDTLKMQDFIELCLACNYEADNKDKFNSLIADLFPERNILLLGVSAVTAVSLGYFMSYSQAGNIRSVTLRPIPHIGDYIEPSGPLSKLRLRSAKSTSQIPVSKMKDICQEYFNKSTQSAHRGNVHLQSSAPASMVPLIQMWQAVEHLPTAEESNIGPIISGLQDLQLEVLDITGYKLGHTADMLIEQIENGHLKHLLELRVGNIGITERQMEILAASLSKTPLLRVIDTSDNEGGESLSAMTESLSSMKSIRSGNVISEHQTRHCCLQSLYINGMHASVQSMSVFAANLPKFTSQLSTLHMSGNDMDDTVAQHLVSNLPTASMLRELLISVYGLTKVYHNQLLSVMQHLVHLWVLRIIRSQYPDALMTHAADVIASLPHLYQLVLGTDHDTSPNVKHSTWRYFQERLQSASNMKYLWLLHIALETDDFLELTVLCRENGYRSLGYSATCLPEGVDVPQDDFFRLL